MTASPIDSAIYRGLMSDAEVARLFTDSAEVRAMMLVEGALAKVQGQLGLIPETAGEAIHRASIELQLDPGALTRGAKQNGVPVPALVTEFRNLMQAPEHAQYIHFGATSQDIVDTALSLRLRQSLAIFETRLNSILTALADLAEAHADLPMCGRTYGQAAVPTSFGAVVTGWGAPILLHLDALPTVRRDIEQVELAGAAGTLSAMGEKGAEVRAEFAKALNLSDPGRSRHATRDRIARLGGWLTALTGSLGKMGADLTLLTQTGIDEVILVGTGESSTMPQKANPVLPSLLVAISTQTAALNTAIQHALVHRQQRDGAAWFTEWMSLPQMLILTACALSTGLDLAGNLAPKPKCMSENLSRTDGLIFAETLTFTLARSMPRPTAEAEVKSLCREIVSTGNPLSELAKIKFPEIDFSGAFEAGSQLGFAPREARDFARAVRKRKI